MTEDFDIKIDYVIRHASVTCDRFERRFAAQDKDWTCTAGIRTFYVHDQDDVRVGSVTAEEIVREGIDTLVNRLIAAQEEPLPFDGNVQDESYSSAE